MEVLGKHEIRKNLFAILLLNMAPLLWASTMVEATEETAVSKCQKNRATSFFAGYRMQYIPLMQQSKGYNYVTIKSIRLKSITAGMELNNNNHCIGFELLGTFSFLDGRNRAEYGMQENADSPVLRSELNTESNPSGYLTRSAGFGGFASYGYELKFLNGLFRLKPGLFAGFAKQNVLICRDTEMLPYLPDFSFEAMSICGARLNASAGVRFVRASIGYELVFGILDISEHYVSYGHVSLMHSIVFQFLFGRK